MAFDIITRLEDFMSVKSDWDTLLEMLRGSDSYTPQLSHDWLATYWEHLAGDAQVEVLVHKDKKGMTVGFSPFMTRRLGGAYGRLGLAELTFLADDKTDRSDFILKDNSRGAAITHDIVPYIESKQSVVSRIHLRRIHSKSPNWKNLKRFWQDAFQPRIENPIAELNGNQDTYYKGIGKNIRREVKKRSLAVANAGLKMTFEYFRNVDDALMRQIVTITESRSQSTGFRTTMLEGRQRRFYEDILRKMAQRQTLAGWVLRLGHKAASFRLGFTDKDILYDWQTNYCPDLHQYDPGKILLAMAIDDCFSRGIRRFDFLCGAEAYKLAWSNRLDYLYTYEWQSTGFRSRLLSTAGAVKRLVFPHRGR